MPSLRRGGPLFSREAGASSREISAAGRGGRSKRAAAVSAGEGERRGGGVQRCARGSRTALPAAARLRSLASPMAEGGAMGASAAGSAASPCSRPVSAGHGCASLCRLADGAPRPVLPVLQLLAPRWGWGLLWGAERNKNKTNGGVLQQGSRACLTCLLVLSLSSPRPV